MRTVLGIVLAAFLVKEEIVGTNKVCIYSDATTVTVGLGQLCPIRK